MRGAEGFDIELPMNEVYVYLVEIDGCLSFPRACCCAFECDWNQNRGSLDGERRLSQQGKVSDYFNVKTTTGSMEFEFGDKAILLFHLFVVHFE